MDFHHKKALICGVARSGIAAAELLLKLGAEPTVSDIKERSKLETEAVALEGKGIKLLLGENPDAALGAFDLIVLSPGIPFDLPFLNKARALGVPVWGEIELAFRVCQSPVIAVTGTNGKTTTTALAGEIFAAHNKNTAVVGNIGVPFCAKAAEAAPDGFVVAEISSFQLETVETFRPRVSAVLNMTPDHLNRHKTMENYIAVKERIFEKQTPEDFTVLNYDDAACQKMAGKTAAQVLFFSRKEPLSQGIYLDGDRIMIRWGGLDTAMIRTGELQIFGSHNIENVMAAAGMAVCAAIPLETIRTALKAFKGVAHRIEYVRTLDGVDFYNDSKATNVDAAVKAIEAMTKPIVLIGGGRDKSGDFSDWVKLFDGKVKCVIPIGEAAELISDTCKAYNYTAVYRANTMKDAVELGFSKAAPGDCVLLSPACASFDLFDSYEQRGDIFKQVVAELCGRGE
ncbi:MAG: UDP-N-acetylmuramoyl-L-alanine--D-glutamate ligase [Clostridiales bacterium]|nr:UDP-N-acetylmuramoyl-L-alanine--D-glutamate ligase [Clostridiales bacterium]